MELVSLALIDLPVSRSTVVHLLQPKNSPAAASPLSTVHQLQPNSPGYCDHAAHFIGYAGSPPEGKKKPNQHEIHDRGNRLHHLCLEGSGGPFPRRTMSELQALYYRMHPKFCRRCFPRRLPNSGLGVLRCMTLLLTLLTSLKLRSGGDGVARWGGDETLTNVDCRGRHLPLATARPPQRVPWMVFSSKSDRSLTGRAPWLTINPDLKRRISTISVAAVSFQEKSSNPASISQGDLYSVAYRR